MGNDGILTMEEFIEMHRDIINALMMYSGLYDQDQEEMENFIINNEELYNQAIAEGVEI